MKSLLWQRSDKAVEIVFQLGYLFSSKTRWDERSRRERYRSLLSALAAENEPWTLPAAAHCLLVPDSDVKREARRAIGQLIASFSPRDLTYVCDRFARAYGWEMGSSWNELGLESIQDIAGNADECGHIAVLGLLSLHRDGYLRHECVRRLARIKDGSELPFLLLRQNDWVLPIANEAHVAIVERITAGHLKHLVRSLHLIRQLSLFRRRDHDDVVRQIIELLLEERHESFLTAIIAGPDKELSRWVFQYALQIEGAHQSRLLMLAIGFHDPFIRLVGSRRISVAYKGRNLRAELDTLATDSFMPVRREALTQLAEHFSDSAVETWKRGLVDASRSIRELARCLLRRLGHSESDIASVYRSCLSNDPNNFSAMEGLAETAEPEDHAYFRERLNHHFPSRRVTAIRGLLKSQQESSLSELVSLLHDTNPRVLREVQNTLSIYPHLVPAQGLVEIALHGDSLETRCTAIRLLANLGKWRSIAPLLTVVARADESTALAAEQKILNWFTPPECNRNFTRPSSQQIDEIEGAVVEHTGQVTDIVLTAISDALRVFG